jgi:hypothetical protein
METNEIVQKFQQFVVDHGLPKTDMALFGIKCPYCGKSDRIRQLEDPDALQGGMNPEDIKKYTEFWMDLTQSGSSLGVCKFCNNPLNLLVEEGKAEGLYR